MHEEYIRMRYFRPNTRHQKAKTCIHVCGGIRSRGRERIVDAFGHLTVAFAASRFRLCCEGDSEVLETRELATTGLRTSIVGFGASPLGGVFGEVTQVDADWMVRAAIDSGVNLFDVSPYYGITKAETVLGKALSGIPRDRYILATKVGRYDSASFDFSAERTAASVDESLRRLQTDHIDLIQCHDIEFGSLDQIAEETIPALRKLQEQGKVRYIGITGLPLGIFKFVLDRAKVDTILSYCHYTLYDNSLEQLLPMLNSASVGIISAAPFGMGLLTDRPLPDWHPAPEPLRQACTTARELCERSGVRISQVALQYALANPIISSTLVGMGNRKQVEENIASAATRPDQSLLAELHALFQDVRNLTWSSGRPENNILPLT